MTGKKKQRSIYLTDETYDNLRLYCGVMDISANEEIEKMIIRYLDEPEIKKALDAIKDLQKTKRGD
jgi:hypothetical protein